MNKILLANKERIGNAQKNLTDTIFVSDLTVAEAEE